MTSSEMRGSLAKRVAATSAVLGLAAVGIAAAAAHHLDPRPLVLNL